MMSMKDLKKIQIVHVVLQLMLMPVGKSPYKSDSHPHQEVPQVRTIYHIWIKNAWKATSYNYFRRFSYVTVGENEIEMQ